MVPPGIDGGAGVVLPLRLRYTPGTDSRVKGKGGPLKVPSMEVPRANEQCPTLRAVVRPGRPRPALTTAAPVAPGETTDLVMLDQPPALPTAPKLAEKSPSFTPNYGLPAGADRAPPRGMRDPPMFL